MEDLLEICKMREVAKNDLENMCTRFREQFSQMVRSKMDLGTSRCDIVLADGVTPQQSLKRAKKLSRVREGDESQESNRLSRKSNSKLLAEAESMQDCARQQRTTTTINETVNETNLENEVIPDSAKQAEHSFARPVRLAKVKAEKNLKEPKTNAKLRRPSNFDATMTMKTEKDSSVVVQATTAQAVQPMDSSIVICDKAPVVVDLLDESDNVNASLLQSI